MATMNISLPNDLKGFIDQQVSEHAYGSASEYLRELIRKQRDVEQLRTLLLAGLNSGPSIPQSPDFFDKMRKRANARATTK